VSKESGRPRNAAVTRSVILEAARSRFIEQGYDGASLRDIASDAGVDVALVSRYFGSKDDLFRAALTSDTQPDGLLEGDLSDFGERVAGMFIFDAPQQTKFEKLLMILRSASSPKAAEVIRACGEETFYRPLAEQLGGANAPVRARLTAALITGLAILRALDEDFLLSSEDRKEFCRRTGEILQLISEAD